MLRSFGSVMVSEKRERERKGKERDREKRDREKEVEVFEVAISPDFSLFFFFLSKPSYLPSLLLSLCFFGTTSSSRSRGASTSF